MNQEPLETTIHKSNSYAKKFMKKVRNVAAGAGLTLMSLIPIQDVFGQTVDANGTNTFNASKDVPITATATNIFDPQGTFNYNINTQTNVATPFGPWQVPEEVVVGFEEEYRAALGKFTTAANPGAHFNAYVAVGSKQQDLKAIVYDVLGRKIGEPTIEVEQGIAHFHFAPNEATASGIYMMKVVGDDFDKTIKFTRNKNASARSIPITPTIMDQLGEYVTIINEGGQANNQQQGGRTLENGRQSGVETYTINIQPGFGVTTQSHDVEILPGNDNNITIDVDMLESGFYSINGNLSADVGSVQGGRARFFIGGELQDTENFSGNTFSFIHNVDHNAQNLYDDINDASIVVDQLDNEFQPTTINFAMTEDAPGENPVPLSEILLAEDATAKVIVKDGNTLINNVEIVADGQTYSVVDTLFLNNLKAPLNLDALARVNGQTGVFFNQASVNYDLKAGENLVEIQVNSQPYSANVTIRDQNTGEAIQNTQARRVPGSFQATDNGVLSLTDIGGPSFTVEFDRTDSTWIDNWNRQLESFNLTQAHQNFFIDVDGVVRTFDSDVTYVVTDDVTSAPIEDAVVTANGVQQNTDSNGQTVFNFAIPADSQKPWLAGDLALTYDIEKANYEDFPEQNVSITDNDPTFNHTLEEIIVGQKTGYVQYFINHASGTVNQAIAKAWQLDNESISYEVRSGGPLADFTALDLANNLPTEYVFEFSSDGLTNRQFTTTYDTITVVEGFQGPITVDVFPIDNEQNIAVFVYGLQSKAVENNKTVEMLRASDDMVLATDMSDSNGETNFVVPGETSVKFRVGDGDVNDYTVTYNTYTTPLVDTPQEQDTTLNVVSFGKITYADDSPVGVVEIQTYKPFAWDIDMLVEDGNEGQDIYYPSNGQRQQYIDYMQSNATLLGHAVPIKPSSTPFVDPTQEMKDNFEPFPNNRNIYDGQIGFNITEYAGTETAKEGIVLDDGTHINLSSPIWELAPISQLAQIDHEQYMGMFPPIDMTAFPTIPNYTTSRDNDTVDQVRIADSQWDQTNMSLWIEIGKTYFNHNGNNNQQIMYSLPNFD